MGFLFASLAARDEDRLNLYALTGLVVGLAFGTAALALRLWSCTATPAETAASSVSETLFSLGCAVVVYAERMMR